jgi:hypothetical protein
MPPRAPARPSWLRDLIFPKGARPAAFFQQ